MKYFGIIIFCLSVLLSCELEKEIDYYTAEESSFIVVNGFISSEHGVNVLISSTVPPNDHSLSDIIEDPKVWLYVNEQAFSKLNKEDQYEFSLPADSFAHFNSEAKFSLMVSADEYDSVESKNLMYVEKVKIDTAYIKIDSIYGRDYIIWEFNDALNVENFYTYEVNYYKNGITNDRFKNFIPISTFNDDGFNGRILRNNNLRNQEYDSIQIKLYVVSESYADFIDSYLDYEISYQDFSYETVYTVESQIDNGFGFFASYEWSEYILK